MPHNDPGTTLQAGFGNAIITPPTPVQLAGLQIEVHEPLAAQHAPEPTISWAHEEVCEGGLTTPSDAAL